MLRIRKGSAVCDHVLREFIVCKRTDEAATFCMANSLLRREQRKQEWEERMNQ